MVSRSRVRKQPRAMWEAMLRILLRRDHGMYHGTNVAASEGESLGDALASLLNDGLWSIVLGEPTDCLLYTSPSPRD